MAYKFNFDFTKVSQSFFRELARITERTRLHKKIGNHLSFLVKRFRIHEITGLDLQSIIEVVTDMVDIQVKNMANRPEFNKAKKRVIFLPQCLREYTHGTCKATFKPEIPSHFCNVCSSNCLVNQATLMGKQKEYDVFIIDGGSCIPRIINQYEFEGVIGVACPSEIKLGGNYMDELSIPWQGVPLTKNGCVYTQFNPENLLKVL